MVRTFLQLNSLNDIYLKHFSKIVKCFHCNAMYAFLEKPLPSKLNTKNNKACGKNKYQSTNKSNKS